MVEKEQINFINLIVKAREGALSQEELLLLKNLMKQPQYRKLYFAATKVSCALNQVDASDFCGNQRAQAFRSIDTKLLEELAESERKAPKLERMEEVEAVPHKVIRPAIEKRTMSRFQKLTLSACAAIILLLLSLNFLTGRTYSVDVATVTDQMNAKWLGSATGFRNGERLWTNKDLLNLDKGVISIKFDDGVDIVIEGPSRFTVERGGVYLEYGRLFSSVSKSGLGFTVDTPKVRFVDQGTEFGVQADINGSSELHVIKGKVQLFAGAKGDAKTALLVTENRAVRYNAVKEETLEIPIENEAFVRSVNSKALMLWHGERKLDVADLFAGGNGFGNVEKLIGLDPASGKYTDSINGSTRITNNQYNTVPESRFIDGVFVPDGGEGKLRISSTGLTFDCPDTSGKYTHEISTYRGSLSGQKTTVPQFVRDGVRHETEPMLFVHSNVGITFDLDKIRNTLPDLRLESFATKAAFPDVYTDDGTVPDVDVFVLADGEVKYHREGFLFQDGIISIDVSLNETDRFLTLIVTEGRSSSKIKDFPWGLDSLFLIEPELTLAEQR
ncbi:MAG: FecR domain-containing protein [Phycisphaerae bacterium]